MNILGREGSDRRTASRFYVTLLQSGDFFWVGYVGSYLPYVEGPCGFPPPGGMADGNHVI